MEQIKLKRIKENMYDVINKKELILYSKDIYAWIYFYIIFIQFHLYD